MATRNKIIPILINDSRFLIVASEKRSETTLMMIF